MLGGDVTVASTPGVGSTFTVTIGTGSLDGVALVGSVAELPVEVGDPLPPVVDVRDMRVLIVEDGVDNQVLIRQILRRAGCATEVVDNGQACLDLIDAAETDFDVVLMDMQMPVVDGLTATRRLRARGCRVPIVALTASAMESDRNASLAAGCNNYLTKPIDRVQLLRTLAQLRATQRDA
jgi:CheY-like chemotaxis protein